MKADFPGPNEIQAPGNTWAFRSRLDTFGVSGGYQSGTDETERRTYFRVMTAVGVNIPHLPTHPKKAQDIRGALARPKVSLD